MAAQLSFNFKLRDHLQLIQSVKYRTALPRDSIKQIKGTIKLEKKLYGKFPEN